MGTDLGDFFYFDFNPNGTLHPLLKAFAKQEDSGLEVAQSFGYWQVGGTERPAVARVELETQDPAAGRQGRGPGGHPADAGSGADRARDDVGERGVDTFTRKPIYTELVNELLSGSIDPVTGG